MSPNQESNECAPLESSVGQQEIRLFSLIALIGIVLLLITFIGFYALLYRRTDAIRRPSASLKYEMQIPCNSRYSSNYEIDNDDNAFDRKYSNKISHDKS